MRVGWEVSPVWLAGRTVCLLHEGRHDEGQGRIVVWDPGVNMDCGENLGGNSREGTATGKQEAKDSRCGGVGDVVMRHLGVCRTIVRPTSSRVRCNIMNCEGV